MYLGIAYLVGDLIAVGKLGADRMLVMMTAYMLFYVFHGMGGSLS